MNTYGKRAITLDKLGALCILLALTLTACEGRDTDEIDDSEAAAMRTEQSDAYSSTPMMKVSFTNSGEMVPTIPAGRATFAVDNTSGEDCNLTLTPQEGGAMTGPGTMGEETTDEDAFGEEMGQDPGTDAPLGSDETATQDGAEAQSGTDRIGTGQGETMQGQPGTAGESEVVTLNLEPGLYEVSCTDDQGMGQESTGQQSTDQLGQSAQSSPMLVMVTEETSLGAGTHGTTQPGSHEPSDTEELDTENQ